MKIDVSTEKQCIISFFCKEFTYESMLFFLNYTESGLIAYARPKLVEMLKTTIDHIKDEHSFIKSITFYIHGLPAVKFYTTFDSKILDSMSKNIIVKDEEDPTIYSDMLGQYEQLPPLININKHKLLYSMGLFSLMAYGISRILLK